MKDLPGGCPGHLCVGHEVDALGTFESGDLAAGKVHDLLGQFLTLLKPFMEHHNRLDGLAPFFVRHADHGDVLDRLVGAHGAFHLGGIDILAPRNDHVGLPVHEGIIPVLIPSHHISCRRPFPLKGLFGLFRFLQILFEQHGGAVKKFSHLAVRDLVSVFIQDADSIDAKYFLSNGTQLLELIFRTKQGHQPPFGATVGLP